MRMEEERLRLAGGDASRPVHSPGLLGKVVTIAAGAVLLVAVFTVSLLVFAIVATAGLLILGYLWWKTRDLRKQIREQMRERRPGERVIEGEVIREAACDDADPRSPRSVWHMGDSDSQGRRVDKPGALTSPSTCADQGCAAGFDGASPVSVQPGSAGR